MKNFLILDGNSLRTCDNKLMKKINVSVIIPTRNEQDILKKNLIKINDFISNLNFVNDYELIISDFSNDATPDIAKDLQKKYKKIKLIKAEKRGIGEGIRQGIKNSRFDLIFFYPIDLTYNLNSIRGMLKTIINNDYDIVLGSRRVKGGEEIKSIKRKVFSLIYSYLVNLLFNLNIKDTQGIVVFKKKRVKFIDKIKADDGFFQTEILIYGRMNKLKIKEYPTIQKDRKDEESNIVPLKEGFCMLKQSFNKFSEINFSKFRK